MPLVLQHDNVWRDVELDPQPELPEFSISPKAKYLSRRALCIGCGQPIHEAPGEYNHHYFGQYDGPYCPPCALRIAMTSTRADAKHDSWSIAKRETTGIVIAIIDVAPERCLIGQRAARPKGKKRELRTTMFPRRSWPKSKVQQIEENWLNFRPFFASPVNGNGLVQPHGKVAAHDSSLYNNRHAELSALIQTQERELATLPELMKANGLSAFSLSSSPESDNDDDLEAGNIAEPTERIGYTETRPGETFDPEAERNAQRYGVSYDTSDLAPVMRRIDWERFILGCNQSNRISVERNDRGGRTLRASNRRWTADHLTKYFPRFKEHFPELPPMEEIERAREAKLTVWDHMTPRQQLLWTKRAGTARFYLDFADPNIEREAWDDELHQSHREQLGGEYELSGGQLFDAAAPFEPREFDLWPLTRFERRNGILPIEAAIRRADAAYRAA